MKALTLWRPWAWAVAHAGKDIENRGWKPPQSIIGQRIAIHAGQRYDREGAVTIIRAGLGAPPSPSVDPAGVIVAVTIVFDWTPVSESPWFGGPIGWYLKDTVALPKPIPCRGAQGLWTVPPNIEARILEQTK